MRYMIAILISTVAVLSSPLATAAGDADRGKALVTEMGCIGCHGPDGNSVANPQWPKLAGQASNILQPNWQPSRTTMLKASAVPTR